MILLRDNAEVFAESGFHPIVEPVKNDFSALKRTMQVMNNKGVGCTLIVNPQIGREPVPASSILEELINGAFKGFKHLSIGYVLHAKSKISELVTLLSKYRNSSFSIVHYGYTNGKELAAAINRFENIRTHIFIEGFAGRLYQKPLKKKDIKRVLIRDGFKAQMKNANYPPTEHFSDLHITFPDEGMEGFGDYLIVGDEYSETGGPAYAVAIHLTYLDSDDDMFIYHFVSDQTDSPTDPGGKFLEALFKLVKEIKKPNSLVFKSKACNEYLDLFKKKHYPGLGYVKKLSMQHHVELIADYIKRAG